MEESSLAIVDVQIMPTLQQKVLSTSNEHSHLKEQNEQLQQRSTMNQ